MAAFAYNGPTPAPASRCSCNGLGILRAKGDEAMGKQDVRADAERLAGGLLDDIQELSRADMVSAVRGFLLGVRDGTLEQAAAVCDRNEEKASAAEIRALKVGRE